MVEPPRDDGGMHRSVVFGGDPRDARAAWRPAPLVQVGHVPVGAERRNVEIDRTGGVGAVDQHPHTAGVTDIGDRPHRQHQGRGGRDVVDHEHARPGTQRSLDRVDERRCVGTRARHLDRAHGGTRDSGGITHRVRDTAVAEVGHEHFVALLPRERAQYCVGTRGGVVDEHRVVDIGTDERGDHRCRLADAHSTAHLMAAGVGQFAEHERRRLTLDLVLDRPLRSEHAARRSTDRSMVEVGDRRVDHPLRQQLATERGHERRR